MSNKIKKVIKYIILFIIMYGLAFVIFTKIEAGFFKYIILMFVSFIIGLIMMKIMREPFSWGEALAGTILVSFGASMAILITCVFRFIRTPIPETSGH
jgi:hypothetical protein